MSEVNVFPQIEESFVTFWGFVSRLPSGIADYKILQNARLQENQKWENWKEEEITNISAIKYDVMHVDICCSTESMACGSPVQMSLNRFGMIRNLFYGFHSSSPKEKLWQSPWQEPPFLTVYLAPDFSASEAKY